MCIPKNNFPREQECELKLEQILLHSFVPTLKSQAPTKGLPRYIILAVTKVYKDFE